VAVTTKQIQSFTDHDKYIDEICKLSRQAYELFVKGINIVMADADHCGESDDLLNRKAELSKKFRDSIASECNGGLGPPVGPKSGTCGADWHDVGDGKCCPIGRHYEGQGTCVKDGWHLVDESSGASCPDNYHLERGTCIKDGEHWVREHKSCPDGGGDDCPD
jgi:hypothetical protein